MTATKARKRRSCSKAARLTDSQMQGVRTWRLAKWLAKNGGSKLLARCIGALDPKHLVGGAIVKRRQIESAISKVVRTRPTQKYRRYVLGQLVKTGFLLQNGGGFAMTEEGEQHAKAWLAHQAHVKAAMVARKELRDAEKLAASGEPEVSGPRRWFRKRGEENLLARCIAALPIECIVAGKRLKKKTVESAVARIVTTKPTGKYRRFVWEELTAQGFMQPDERWFVLSEDAVRRATVFLPTRELQKLPGRATERVQGAAEKTRQQAEALVLPEGAPA